jgi:AraC-like DNA-binding protein/uncharacterized RmlC-like cupin family protein
MHSEEARVMQLQPATGRAILFNDLSVYCSNISMLINPPGTKTPPHFHDFYELLLLFEGKQFMTVLGHEQVNSAGDFTLMPPGVLHGHSDYPGCDQRAVVIRFTAKKVECGENTAPIADKLLTTLSKTHFVPLSDPVITEMLSNPEPDYLPEYAKLDFMRLIMRVADDFRKDENVEARTVKPRVINDRDLVENVIMSITTMYMTDINVVLLARMHSISYRHLARIFMDITGYTLTEYIVFTRLFYSMQFLVETDLSVADIAKQVGFRSDNYFSKVFTQMTGITPTAYRKERAGKAFVPPDGELPGIRDASRHNELYNPLRPHNMDSSRIQFMAGRGAWK